MSKSVKRDTTNYSWRITFLDSDGSLVTGKTYSDITSMGWRRYNGGQEVTEVTSRTPASIASKATAHTDDGFLEDVDDTGTYRYDVADAAIETGADSADNVEPILACSGVSSVVFDRIQLVDFDPENEGVNVTEINNSSIAAARLALSAAQIIPGVVDTTAVAATTTSFESDTITEATDDHYVDRLIVFTSGNLSGQVASITDYVLNGGRGAFTVTEMTESPANNDPFIII